MGVKFEPGVCVRDGSFFVTIDWVSEARALLSHIPRDRRGPLYHVTVEIMLRAEEGQVSPNEAREAFLRFADDAGILAEDRAA